MILTSCTFVMEQRDLLWKLDICPGNTENVEGLVLSQEGKQRTNSGKVRDVQHNISDFSQQDYQVQFATEVHVGLLRPLYLVVCSTAPLLTAFFIRAFSTQMLYLFSENILYEREAP